MRTFSLQLLALTSALAVVVGSAPTAAQEPVAEEAGLVIDGAAPRDDADRVQAEPPTPDKMDAFADQSPEERVLAARRAFQNADFEMLRPLLQPLLGARSAIEDPDLRVEARQLLGAALFFEAQQVTDAQRRKQLLVDSRHHFLELLRERPEHSLDALLFPASVVELFEEVRQENQEELDALLALRQSQADTTGNPELQMLYIEREVQSRNYALNFFPLGLGQFQNDAPVKGTLFAVGQIAALGLNVVSYWMIESLRGPDGRFDPGADRRGGAYAEALGWRQMQYGSLAAFGMLYGWSIIDAVLGFEAARVHIRTLDTPPPELDLHRRGGAGIGRNLGLGWTLTWQW